MEFEPNRQYFCNGAASLTDGLLGSETNRSEYWLGFEGDDLIFEIDLGKEQQISEISTNFLQRTGSWILMPKEVIFEIMSENKNSVHKDIVVPEATLEVIGTVVEELRTKANVSGRYIKVKAVNYKILPEWHKWAGNKSWLFVDEIIIN